MGTAFAAASGGITSATASGLGSGVPAASYRIVVIAPSIIVVARPCAGVVIVPAAVAVRIGKVHQTIAVFVQIALADLGLRDAYRCVGIIAVALAERGAIRVAIDGLVGGRVAVVVLAIADFFEAGRYLAIVGLAISTAEGHAVVVRIGL